MSVWLPALAGRQALKPLLILAAIALVAGDTGQDCQEAQALARQTYEERRYDQSALYFARAVTSCGPSAPLLLALGQAHLLAQHPADAVAALDRIPTGDYDYVPALKVKAKA